MPKLNCFYILSNYLSPEQYVILSFVGLAVLAYFLRGYFNKFVFLGLGMMSIGALFNAASRLKNGCVADPLNFFDLAHFNFADILVTLGIISVGLGLYYHEKSITN